jgi:DNA-binding NtrC family response regulator
VVDEDPCEILQVLLREEGYDVTLAGNAFQGLEILGESRPHLVITELRIPGLDGLTFIERVRSVSPATRIFVITAYGSVGNAVEAIKRGADEFLEKPTGEPVDPEPLRRRLRRSMELALRVEEAHASPRSGDDPPSPPGVVANHPSMRAVLVRVEQVATSRATVLLSGESGTGKGLLALAIPEMSERRRGPCVELTCAALPETLLESELFGHEKGAFTGAVTRHEGRFMRARGGTLFLDEIGSCPLSMQVKLLRFLQSREFERVGGRETLGVDVRLIAATNQDLRTEVDAGRFRADLYYRLNVVHVRIPPLRLRRSDIPALAATFLKRFAAENDRRLEGFSREALELLMVHAWPGNVRELEHAVEHAAIMARGPRVTPDDLPDSLLRRPSDPLEVTIPGSTLAEIERKAILETIMATGGNAAEAAAVLGISKSKIYYRLRDYGAESSGDDEA